MASIRIILLAVIIAVPSLAAAQPTSCSQFFPQGAPPALLNPKLGQRVTVLCNDGYAVAESGITRGTLWSAEHLTAADVALARDLPRAGSFHADTRIRSPIKPNSATIVRSAMTAAI